MNFSAPLRLFMADQIRSDEENNFFFYDGRITGLLFFFFLNTKGIFFLHAFTSTKARGLYKGNWCRSCLANTHVTLPKKNKKN